MQWLEASVQEVPASNQISRAYSLRNVSSQEYISERATFDRDFCSFTVKSLMYGFGDDRNPSNDTVNVMEEILIEYITDVVCLPYHAALKQ